MKYIMLLIIILVSINAYASIPILDGNGCTIGTKGVEAFGYKEDTITHIPFYLTLGRADKQTFVTHPYNHSEIICSPVIHTKIEILLPITHKLVGHLEYIFSDIFITVPTSNEVKWFPTKDVFVESTGEWNFKEFRK